MTGKKCEHMYLYNNSTREFLICLDCGAEVEPDDNW